MECLCCFFFKQKTGYELRISDWSSDVCSSDLRPRASGWSRRLHAETVLTPADLVWPLFVVEGEGVEQPVASLPGVSRWSVDGIVTRAKEARDLGKIGRASGREGRCQ